MERLNMGVAKLTTISVGVMTIGLIAFLLTPLFLSLWKIDTDVMGLIIFALGLALYIIGIIRREKITGWKLILMYLFVGILCFPTLLSITTSVYFFITGEPLG